MLQIQDANEFRKTNKKPATGPGANAKVAPQEPINCGLTFEVETITPEQAKLYFEQRHPNQRKLNDNKVRRFLDIMRAGEWSEPPFTFDSIAFDAEGLLVNGQGRMKALSMHDCPLQFIVIRNVVAPEAQFIPEGDKPEVRQEYFTANIHRHDYATCNVLSSYLAKSANKPAPFVVRRIYSEVGDALEVLPEYRKPKQISSLVRSAFVLYWKYMATPSQRLETQSQYEALAKLDFDRMTPATLAYVRREIESPFGSSGGSARTEHFKYIIGMLRNPNLDNPKPARSKNAVAYDPDALTYPRQYMAHLIAGVRR